MRLIPALLLGLPLLSIGLRAQIVPARQDEMTWDGPRVVVSHRETRTFRFHAPGQGSPTELRAPESSWDLHFREGAAFCLRKEAEGARQDARVLLMSTNLQAWTRYGSFQDKEAHLLHCYPLDDHRFFLVALPSKPFRLGNKVSPFAIGRMNQGGNIETLELTNLGFPKPLLVKTRADRFALDPAYEYLHTAILHPSPFVPLRDGFALVADQVGVFWIFDGKGRMRKRIKLYNSVSEERLAQRDSLEQAVLGCQPREDGQILIASRTEEAVLNARRQFPRDESLEAFRDPEARKEAARQEQKSLEAFPELKWHLLDPDAGTVNPCDPPLKVKDHFDEVSEISRFKFRFLPNGNLRFGDEDPAPASRDSKTRDR